MPPTDLSLQIQLHPFPDGDAVAQALAQAVADDLRTALALRGQASIALSGGTTPRRFLQAWRAAREAPKPYTAGTWGPSAAIALIERDGRTWADDA